MSEDSVRFDLDALNARVADDAGAPEFPALAEALRRAGDAEGARGVAEAGLESAPSRLAGRVALALARMDLGEPDLGRAELETVLDEMLEPYRLDAEPEAPLEPAAAHGQSSSGFTAVADDEIDAAFDEAEAQADEMHSPNRMAESILDTEAPFEEEPAAAIEAPFEEEPAAAIEAPATESGEFDVTASDAFATRTMAGLLEQQGDHARAHSILTVLEDGEPMGEEIASESMTADFQPARTSGAFDPVDAPDALEIDDSDASAALAFDAEEGELEPAPMDAAEVMDATPIEAEGAGAEAADRARVLATLERWLHNVRRGVA